MSTPADMFQDWPQRAIPDLQAEAPNIRKVAAVRQAHTTELKWKPAPDKSVVDWLHDVHTSKGRLYDETDRKKPYVGEDFDVDSFAVADYSTEKKKDGEKKSSLWGDDTVIAMRNSQLHEHPLTIIKRSTLSGSSEWVCKLCMKTQTAEQHMQCTEGCGFTACISCVDAGSQKNIIKYTERDLRNIRMYAKIPDPNLLVPFDFECVLPPNSTQLPESSILLSAYKRPMSRVEQLQDDDDYYLTNSKRGWNSSNQGPPHRYDHDRRYQQSDPPTTRGFFDEPGLIQSYANRGNQTQNRRPYYNSRDRDNETFGYDNRDDRDDANYRASKSSIGGALDKFMELNPHLRVRKETL